MSASSCSSIDLTVRLGRLQVPNPILVASGTFGYAREMESFANLADLGGIIPKTVTLEPRMGNHPWRTIDDVMEFIVAGASAVHVGTASFYNPGASDAIIAALPAVLEEAGVEGVAQLVGSLQVESA